MQTQSDTNTKQLQLVELDEKLKSLKEKAAKSKFEAKESFEKQVKAVEDQMEIFRAQLNKASMKTGSAYVEIRDGLDDAWNSLKQSFDSASKHLH